MTMAGLTARAAPLVCLLMLSVAGAQPAAALGDCDDDGRCPEDGPLTMPPPYTPPTGPPPLPPFDPPFVPPTVPTPPQPPAVTSGGATVPGFGRSVTVSDKTTAASAETGGAMLHYDLAGPVAFRIEIAGVLASAGPDSDVDAALGAFVAGSSIERRNGVMHFPHCNGTGDWSAAAAEPTDRVAFGTFATKLSAAWAGGAVAADSPGGVTGAPLPGATSCPRAGGVA